MKNLSLLAICLLLTASFALAQTQKNGAKPRPIQGAPTTCGADPVLASDGTETPQDLIAPGSNAYFTLNAKSGHSYAVEAWDTVDQTVPGSLTIQLLAADCVTAVPSTDVTSVDADLSGGFARRISWIQASDATIQIQLTNTDQDNPYAYQVRITDTTLFNTRWSTFGGYITSWGLTNTTSTPVTGTMTVVNSKGMTVATKSTTLAANTATFLTTQDLKVPADDAGGSSFAYVGPPGAVIGDGFLVSANGAVVTPILFENKHAFH